ncbi:neural cell adhesion molecule 2-like, partial [Exaiptasia diaphana]|uniref:Uncharacterized protein n=1 Tax=Exaiptasia diaphana TaxID=2652724 RepID=A0A913YRD1_EXADI
KFLCLDKPTVGKASSTTNISSWAGNKINLECYWSSSLPIPRWTWFKPNGDRITNVRSISSGSQVTVLTGNNNHDYGMYRCKATNIAGSDQHNISVTRLFPPVRPPLIDVASIRSSSVTIIWARPADNGGSPVTGYKVLIDSRTFYINSSKILVYQEFTGLQEHTEYNVTVLARNIAGFGDASFKVFNTTTAKQEPKRESRHASTQDNCNTKVGVLAAFLAISLLSIVILLAFMILKHRRTNSQNSNQQEPKKDAVYENSDAIGMVHLTSSSSPSFKTNQKSHKTALPTEARNPNQEHYQQLNPSTLQSSTATVPTYEPLRKNDVTIAECKGHHTHPTLQSRTRGYKNP